jgi:hypothetical protein
LPESGQKKCGAHAFPGSVVVDVFLMIKKIENAEDPIVRVGISR